MCCGRLVCIAMETTPSFSLSRCHSNQLICWISWEAPIYMELLYFNNWESSFLDKLERQIKGAGVQETASVVHARWILVNFSVQNSSSDQNEIKSCVTHWVPLRVKIGCFARHISQLALETESPGPKEHKTTVGSGIELLLMISEGFKVSDILGVQVTKHQSFTPDPGITDRNCSAYRHPNQQVSHGTWNLWPGVLPPINTKAIVLVFWQKLMPLEFFKAHMKTNLLFQRNTKVQLVLQIRAVWQLLRELQGCLKSLCLSLKGFPHTKHWEYWAQSTWTQHRWRQNRR